MRICDDGHDEMVYEGDSCPGCVLLEDIDNLESKLRKSDEEYNQLDDEKRFLEAQIESLEAEIERLKESPT